MFKTHKILLASIISVAFVATSQAGTPSSFDTKFNIKAVVPDQAGITDASGLPVTVVDIELKPATSGLLEAVSPSLRLRSNEVKSAEGGKKESKVSLKLDGDESADGSAFALAGGSAGVFDTLQFNIETETPSGTQAFDTSGSSNSYSLKVAAGDQYAELPILFKFSSKKQFREIKSGDYKGVVYANVSVEA